MPVDQHQQGWMPAGPLMPLDWLSMPDFVQRWYTPDLGAIPSFPVGYAPPGAMPRGSNTTRAQVPAVVPQPTITSTNTQPPPLIPAGVPVIPTGGVFQSEPELENEVALSDWIQGGIDIANAWGQQPVWQAPAQFAGPAQPAGPIPAGAVTSGATPGGMYYDKHGHLVHRRRRARPCITQTNLNLAYQVAQLPNNANVRMFLAKCVK